MTVLKELVDVEDLEEVWETSKKKPTLVFKHSTTCPVSADAFEQFQQFLSENKEDLGAYFVKVRESRPVSNAIAEELGVVHQSPQIILVNSHEAKWDTSHFNITVEAITDALKSN